MPEVVERRLVCDVKDCGKPGKRYVIDAGLKPVQVILCKTHGKPIEDAVALGQPAPPPRVRKSRGLSEERLRSLIVPDEE